MTCAYYSLALPVIKALGLDVGDIPFSTGIWFEYVMVFVIQPTIINLGHLVHGNLYIWHIVPFNILVDLSSSPTYSSATTTFNSISVFNCVTRRPRVWYTFIQHLIPPSISTGLYFPLHFFNCSNVKNIPS